MLGRALVTADETLAGATTFALGAVAGASLAFWVEEDEMLVDLECQATITDASAEAVDLTLFVDGVDVAASADLGGGADGLLRMTYAAAATHTLAVAATVRLDPGQHQLELRAKCASGALDMENATFPLKLVARRHSHPATLGHGVDSKAQLIQ